MKTLAGMALLAALAASAAPLSADPVSVVDGVWRNPRGTIDVRIAPCGDQLCGTVARASPEAMQDARDAGVPNLIGVQLLQNYHQVAPDRWEGRVYVPDMGGTFSSHIVKVSPSALRIAGCLIGGWICKSQLWTRV